MQKAQNFCEFCQILQRKDMTSTVIAQNTDLFAFHDLDDSSAQAHILVCTKKHIQSALHLIDPQIAVEMKQFGGQILYDLYRKKYTHQPKEAQFRFGFHLPPFISIDHIHLHCFILPFKSLMIDKIKYGSLLKSVQEVEKLIKKPKL